MTVPPLRPALPPDVRLDEAAWPRLEAFVAALLAENERLNLTGAKTADALWRVHVADSLALLACYSPAAGQRALDIGSGGGLPGLVVACAVPQQHWLLIDSVRKKIDALNRIIEKLGLTNAEARWGRAEALARESTLREQFAVVTARAVAALTVLVEYAAGFVAVGGTAWFYKSASAAEREIAAARPVAGPCGFELIFKHAYRLAGEDADRVLIGYRKVASAPSASPRAAGGQRGGRRT